METDAIKIGEYICKSNILFINEWFINILMQLKLFKIHLVKITSI